MATTYTPTGTHNDAGVSAADLARINDYKTQWTNAYNAGDQAAMAAAHAAAEAIRANYNYSGGSDGSEYNPFNTTPNTQNYYSASVQYAPVKYTPAQISTASSAAKYIDSLYAAQEAAYLNALKAAYDSNVYALNSAGEKIPKQYHEARNQTAAQSEVQRANFNELAAGRGLNSGAGSQMFLSMGNNLQSALAGISSAEADALSALDLQRSQLESAYRNDVAQAVADGNLSKAQALYNDYIRVDNSLVSASQAQADEDYRAWSANFKAGETYLDLLQKQAETLAAYGDYSGYAALGYSPSQIAKLEEDYAITNNWFK